jgi:Flp pilus assembly protein TadG
VGRVQNNDRGASLVEFAILAPFLILLLFGIIEFGWLFGQFNDVRHGAREGARFAAVNAGTSTQVKDTVCTSMEGLSAGMSSITIDIAQGGVNVGDQSTITVTANVTSLSGVPLITTFLPDELSSTVTFRHEQVPTWTTQAGMAC